MALLAPDAIMRADLVGQRMGTESVYEGAEAVAARFNGAQGAAPVVVDGELSAAWIAAGHVRVAFIFHVEAGLISEVELIANKEVLATMDFVPLEGDAPMEN
jgi:RNA polymerase sigma-70 factor (ECF subfamily)